MRFDHSIVLWNAWLQQLDLNAQAVQLLQGLGLGEAAQQLESSNANAEAAVRKVCIDIITSCTPSSDSCAQTSCNCVQSCTTDYDSA